MIASLLFVVDEIARTVLTMTIHLGPMRPRNAYDAIQSIEISYDGHVNHVFIVIYHKRFRRHPLIL